MDVTRDVIDIRALEEAVILFYRSGSTQQAAAHEWLTKAQSSQQAWSFVWDLMRLDKVFKILVFFFSPNLIVYSKKKFHMQSSEVQFFGATTLHFKLVKSWSEVPKENYEELKQKLLESIITFGRGPKIVLNRLCISVNLLSLFVKSP